MEWQLLVSDPNEVMLVLNISEIVDELVSFIAAPPVLLIRSFL